MTLYWKRFVWRDDRYEFSAMHYTNKDGLAPRRSASGPEPWRSSISARQWLRSLGIENDGRSANVHITTGAFACMIQSAINNRFVR
jgi:hypothetical protein